MSAARVSTERGVRARRPDDGLGLGAHLGEQRVDEIRIEIVVEPHIAAARDLVGDRRAQEAERRADAGAGWDDTRPMPSFSASRAACSGAAPPKAISVRASSSLPRSTACTRAAFAMFSSTISLTPNAASSRVQAERLADRVVDRRRRALRRRA